MVVRHSRVVGPAAAARADFLEDAAVAAGVRSRLVRCHGRSPGESLHGIHIEKETLWIVLLAC